jgi:rfaE bifunctional protein nucleotidyltransferase chain/domain
MPLGLLARDYQMSDKLKNLTELKNIVDEAKRHNKNVIFANGIFDIIHVGHIRYLKEAKTLGDILIVAVNSDASAKKIKGEDRPYTNEKERLEILSEFTCIDYLILFDDTDVRRLLGELKPDVQAKGTDYTEDSVPERDVVLSYGGKVMITGDKKEHSSTEIIRELKAPPNRE